MEKRRNVMVKKKLFLFVLFLGLWVFVGAGSAALAQKSPQLPLAPNLIPKFVNQLPLLSIDTTKAPNNTMQTALGNGPLTLSMYPFKAQVLPPGTVLTDNPLTSLVPDGTTDVFGYINGTSAPAGAQDTYIGPVLVNVRNGGSTNITFVNNLGGVADLATPIWYKYAIDQTLHWADPLGVGPFTGTPESNYCFEQAKLGVIQAQSSPCAATYAGPIAAVPHIHGGEVPAELDGGPDAWFTSDGKHVGHAFYSFGWTGLPQNFAQYNYPNTQEAGPIWYHDHLLGGTRLNVFAGLAGAYLIIDPTLTLPTGMNAVGLNNGTLNLTGILGSTGLNTELIVPLAIQDRMFDTEGQFFYQSDSAGNILWATNPEHPYWTPEFIGDVILVNGKAWPNLNVQAKRYRFLLINGSNARTYELSIPKGPNFYVIGTDGGYLDTAAVTNKLVIMPGERYEVIMDFAGSAGKNLIMKNTARAPYPGGVPTNNDTGVVMQFTVAAAVAGFVDNSYNPAVAPAIRTVAQMIKRLPTTGYTPALTRQLTLNEVLNPPKTVQDPVTGLLTAYPGGPLEILVNNTGYGGFNRQDFTPITTPIPGSATSDVTYYSELPQEGTTEMWEIVNLTADAHPIHLHLVQYQIINRQNYATNKYVKAYNAAFGGGGYVPGNGPPLSYSPTAASGMKLGGNPDVALFLQGAASPPLPEEAGWKDTVVAYPGQVTRIAVRWAPTDAAVTPYPNSLGFAFSPSSGGSFPHGWVWHCHIVDHEDNEMMRPFTVNDNAGVPPTIPAPTRTLVKGANF
jgi:spore coat protein A, manganese oxidase